MALVTLLVLFLPIVNQTIPVRSQISFSRKTWPRGCSKELQQSDNVNITYNHIKHIHKDNLDS